MTPSIHLRLLWVLVPSLLLSGCFRNMYESEDRSGRTRIVRLVSAVTERETARFTKTRNDVEVESRDEHAERIPHIVTVAETPRFPLKEAKARLYGDENGKLGFQVDNFLLLEVFDENERVVGRGVVGYADAVYLNHERVDNIGQPNFSFDPGEVDITPILPVEGDFSIRSTVLDTGGVGKVSDIYLLLQYIPGPHGAQDLRNQ